MNETPCNQLLEILTDLTSSQADISSSALERMAILFADLTGLSAKGWLVQASESNGVEVELLADEKRLPSIRWQIQCQNSALVSIDSIAAALGRSFPMRPCILLSATTGVFTSEARVYTTKSMQSTCLQIYLVEGCDLRSIADDKDAFVRTLAREAKRARTIKERLLSLRYCSYDGGAIEPAF